CCNRDCGGGHHLPGDADLEAIANDLNLAQTGLVQKLGKVADHRLLDAVFVLLPVLVLTHADLPLPLRRVRSRTPSPVRTTTQWYGPRAAIVPRASTLIFKSSSGSDCHGGLSSQSIFCDIARAKKGLGRGPFNSFAR